MDTVEGSFERGLRLRNSRFKQTEITNRCVTTVTSNLVEVNRQNVFDPKKFN